MLLVHGTQQPNIVYPNKKQSGSGHIILLNICYISIILLILQLSQCLLYLQNCKKIIYNLSFVPTCYLSNCNMYAKNFVINCII